MQKDVTYKAKVAKSLVTPYEQVQLECDESEGVREDISRASLNVSRCKKSISTLN